MTIECKDFLAFARLMGQQDSEVAFRSAISRAYYAAFHCCKQWEQTLPMLGRNEGPEGGSQLEETVTASDMHDQLGQVRQVLERCDTPTARSDH